MKTTRFNWSRYMQTLKKNYALWPILGLCVVIVPVGLSGFLYYRISHTPEFTFDPRSRCDPEPWNKFDHKRSKMIQSDQSGYEHPRPTFWVKKNELQRRWQNYYYSYFFILSVNFNSNIKPIFSLFFFTLFCI